MNRCLSVPDNPVRYLDPKDRKHTNASSHLRHTTKTAKVVLITAILAGWLPGCCATAGRTDPPRPDDAVGWNRYGGRFLLRKGEQTDNGRLEVKVLELMPPHCLAEQADPAARARAKLEFRALSDPDHPCSDVFPEHDWNVGLKCLGLNHELETLGVEVRRINLKEGWVYFDLTERTAKRDR